MDFCTGDDKRESGLMLEMVEGSCLCGKVRFRIAGVFDNFFLCHCSRCQKDTGSAHAANLFSSTATVSWLSGYDCIKTYHVPDSRHEKSFCVECGSALPSVQLNRDLLVVPAGSLDTLIDIRPDAHICFASRALWDEKLEDILSVDKLPS